MVVKVIGMQNSLKRWIQRVIGGGGEGLLLIPFTSQKPVAAEFRAKGAAVGHVPVRLGSETLVIRLAYPCFSLFQ